MAGVGRLIAVAAGVAFTWAVTPWVAMAARGTVDQRDRAAVRRLGRDTVADMPAAWETIPEPRPLEPAGLPRRADVAPPSAVP